MRKTFYEFFGPTDEERKNLWATATFSFDASVLLNLYRYTEETSKSLLEFIRQQAPRIWLPHQFALEFARNRHTVIAEQDAKYESACKDCKKNRGVAQRKRTPTFDTEGQQRDRFHKEGVIRQENNGGKPDFDR